LLGTYILKRPVWILGHSRDRMTSTATQRQTRLGIRTRILLPSGIAWLPISARVNFPAVLHCCGRDCTKTVQSASDSLTMAVSDGHCTASISHRLTFQPQKGTCGDKGKKSWESHIWRCKVNLQLRLSLAWHVARMEERRNAYRVWVGKPEGKRPLGRPRPRCNNNIKMYLWEIGCGMGMDSYDSGWGSSGGLLRTFP
jgi:hypothetical protein